MIKAVVLATAMFSAMGGPVHGPGDRLEIHGSVFSPILLQPVLVHGGYGFMLRVSGGMMAGVCALTWAIGRILFKRGEERTDM